MASPQPPSVPLVDTLNQSTSTTNFEHPEEKAEESAASHHSISDERDVEKADVPQQPLPVSTTSSTPGASQPAGPGARGNVNDLSSVPNGGLKAWLQVAGSFVLFFNTWGIVNTYGVYQTYYALEILRDTDQSTIAWIGSIQAFLLLIVGVLTGPLYDAGYFKPMLLIGSFLVVFGHMMLSLATEFWQVLLAQAFCIGLGMGCLFIPSVAIISTYFTTKLAFATGIAASGSSLGGVIYPIVLHRLLPRIGFPWAVRVIGFMALGLLVIPNLVMKVRVLPAERRKMIDLPSFKDVPFMLFCFALFISIAGIYQPFFFIQSYAIVENITTEDLAFYLLSILNAMSIFGRIVPNFIADKLGPMNVITPCALMSGVLVFCLIAVHNAGGIIVWVLFYGFFSGSLVSLPPTVTVHLTKDRRIIGTRLGMAFAFVGAGTLIGSPIGGVLLRGEGGFRDTWIFGGAFATVGGLLIAVARVTHKGPSLMIKA